MLAQPTGNHRRFKRASTWQDTTTYFRVRHTLIAGSSTTDAPAFACRVSAGAAWRQFEGRSAMVEAVFDQRRVQTLEARQ